MGYRNIFILDYNRTSFFTNMSWTGDSEWTFRSSSQASACPPDIQSLFMQKMKVPFFTVFDFTRLGIEPDPTVSVADALTT